MKKTFILIIISFTLAGCSFQSSFTPKSTSVSYKEDLNTCEFIQEIDGTEITKDMIVENQINLPGGKTFVCPGIKDAELGEYELTYVNNSRKEKIKIKLIDDAAPVITIKEPVLETVVGNGIDISKNFSATDNYDKWTDIKFDMSPLIVDFMTPNEVVITVTATDTSGNKSTAKFTVRVKEAERQDSGQSEPSGGGGSNSTEGGSSGGSSGSSNSSGSSYTGVTKYFMFSDGYDLNTGMSACQSYRNNEVAKGASYGSCSPVYADGVATGYVAKFN